MEQDSTFSGLVIDDIRLTIQLYADDTNGFVSSENDVKKICDNFKIHEEASASKLNTSKCAAIIIYGMTKNQLAPFKVLENNEFEWLLGVPFGPQDTNILALQRIEEKFNRKMDIWKSCQMAEYNKKKNICHINQKHQDTTTKYGDCESKSKAQKPE